MACSSNLSFHSYLLKSKEGRIIMKRILNLSGFGLLTLILVFAIAQSASAQWFAVAAISGHQAEEDVPTKSVYIIPPDTPEFYCAWSILGTKSGDKISGTLIAEDVGKVAPPNYEVMTAVYDVPKGKSDNAWGHFNFTKPTNGWPVGYYRVEIRKNGVLVAGAMFEIIKPQ
jgi:hypothetical protein